MATDRTIMVAWPVFRSVDRTTVLGRTYDRVNAEVYQESYLRNNTTWLDGNPHAIAWLDSARAVPGTARSFKAYESNARALVLAVVDTTIPDTIPVSRQYAMVWPVFLINNFEYLNTQVYTEYGIAEFTSMLDDYPELRRWLGANPAPGDKLYLPRDENYNSDAMLVRVR